MSLRRDRRSRFAAAVLAGSVLAAVMALAPAAQAQPYTIEVEGCDADDLVEAVEIANAVEETDIIVLDDRCRYEFEHGYFVNGEFTDSALPLVLDNLIIYGNKSKVVGGGDDNGGGFRFMSILDDNPGVTVEIRDLTISGFELSVVDPFRSGGGAILNRGANLILRNSTVRDNEIQLVNIESNVIGPEEPVFLGGGVGSLGGSVTIRDTTVAGNEVNVLRLPQGPFGPSHFVIGGGVASHGGAGIDIASSTVKGNRVNAVGIGSNSFASGGGVVVANEFNFLQEEFSAQFVPGATGELTMDRTTVSGNSVSTKSSGEFSSAVGGGIYLDFSNFMHEISRSVVSGNRATAKGVSGASATAGGVFNANGSDGGLPGLLVDDDTPPAAADIRNVKSGDRTSITNNTASCDDVCGALGGGYASGDILLPTEGPGSAEFHRTVFKGNVADGDDGMGRGGGLAITGDGVGAPELVLDDATVTKNTAKGDGFARGGGIWANDSDDVELDDSDVTRNKPDDCWAQDVGEFCDFS